MTIMLASLHRGRDAVEPALRAAIARLDASSRHQAEYHLGWTTVDGQPVAGGGGKAVRPALALLSAEAAGAAPEVGLPGAVAVELVHNFSLLHDDVMDGDKERRHRPTVWALWGVASAILTGDAMLALAQEALLDSGSPFAAPAAYLLSVATRDLIRGQVQDLAFERRDDVTLPECLDMAAGKTGALLSASASIGAVLAGAPTGVVDALSHYGSQLGLAFQLIDDVLGIWGDPATTGKPVYSDLRAGKKSLPISFVLARADTTARRLAAAIVECGQSAEADPELLRATAELVTVGGGRDWAVAEANRRLELGERALERAAMPAHARTELTALGRFIVSRDN
jgi:geranylgeranyl diphosphate synthase type I